MAITHYPIDPPAPLQPGWYVVGIEDERGLIEPAESKEDAFAICKQHNAEQILYIPEAMLATSILRTGPRRTSIRELQ